LEEWAIERTGGWEHESCFSNHQYEVAFRTTLRAILQTQTCDCDERAVTMCLRGLVWLVWLKRTAAVEQTVPLTFPCMPTLLVYSTLDLLLIAFIVFVCSKKKKKDMHISLG
jgi:hypothetical protein